MISMIPASFDPSQFEVQGSYGSQVFQRVVLFSLQLESWSSRIGAYLTVLSLIILLQKSMRTSSINVILAAIAVCNLVCMIIILYNWHLTEDLMNPCTPPRTLFEYRVDWILTCLHNVFRRCSAWLGVLMTVLRYSIISDIARKKYTISRPIFGLQMFLCCLFLSFWFASMYYFNMDIVQIGTWRADPKCESYSLGKLPVYTLKYNPYFERNGFLCTRIKLILEGLFGKLFPCFTSSIFTCLILRKLRRTLIPSMSTVEVSNRSNTKSRKDRTSILTIYISTLFFLSELPIGSVDMYKGIWNPDGYNEIAEYVVLLCDAIFTINTTLHCVVIGLMSSQYRRTGWNLILRLNCFRKNALPRVVTVHSSY